MQPCKGDNKVGSGSVGSGQGNVPLRRGWLHAEVTLRWQRHVKRASTSPAPGSAASLTCNVIPAPKPALGMGKEQAGRFSSCQAGLEAPGAAKGLGGAALHAALSQGCLGTLSLSLSCWDIFWSLNQGISCLKNLQKMQQCYSLQLSSAQKMAWGGA